LKESDFNQWVGLVHHVLQVYFYWAFKSGDEAPKKFRRHFDYDDLAQEGCVALIDAWERWRGDGGAEFKTYAFTSIYRKIFRFIDANNSPITTKNWRQATESDSSVEEHLNRAVSCRLFSELNPDGNNGYSIGLSSPDVQFEDADSSESYSNVIYRDWQNRCLELLKKELNKSDYTILMKRARGMHFQEIGKSRNITREAARKQYNKAIVRAAVALIDLEEQHYGTWKERDTGKKH
jgi:RNA polymerase sigma factor (sigma-70 family)